jgi:hypothetical protein
VSAGDVSVRLTGLSLGPPAPDPLMTPVRGGYPQGTLGYLFARLAAGPVVVVSPATRDGKLRVVQGDSYMAVDGRAIDLPRVEGDSWPADLSDWSLSFDAAGGGGRRLSAGHARLPVRSAGGGGRVEAAGVSAPVPAGPGQLVRVELAADVTSRLRTGWRWAVEASKSGRVVTLRRGPVEALAPV